jgi:hypothetical protein
LEVFLFGEPGYLLEIRIARISGEKAFFKKLAAKYP